MSTLVRDDERVIVMHTTATTVAIFTTATTVVIFTTATTVVIFTTATTVVAHATGTTTWTRLMTAFLVRDEPIRQLLEMNIFMTD